VNALVMGSEGIYQNVGNGLDYMNNSFKPGRKEGFVLFLYYFVESRKTTSPFPKMSSIGS